MFYSFYFSNLNKNETLNTFNPQYPSFKGVNLEKSYTLKHCSISTAKNTVLLRITRFSDIVKIIIPFFDKYSILGFKSSDYEDWKKVVEIIKTKDNLDSPWFDSIKKINSTMNLRRPWK